MAYALDSGMVLINTPRGRALYAPFGGFKDSGYGKVGGKEAVMEYIRLKNVYMTLD
jgi:aldehyde dehydrogenase (NAD+)